MYIRIIASVRLDFNISKRRTPPISRMNRETAAEFNCTVTALPTRTEFTELRCVNFPFLLERLVRRRMYVHAVDVQWDTIVLPVRRSKSIPSSKSSESSSQHRVELSSCHRRCETHDLANLFVRKDRRREEIRSRWFVKRKWER